MESKSLAGSGGQNAGDMEPLADPRLAALQVMCIINIKRLGRGADFEIKLTSNTVRNTGSVHWIARNTEKVCTKCSFGSGE